MTSTTRGADLLVSMLAEAGVDVVFGLPGGAISPVHDALLDRSIRVITTRHEAGADPDPYIAGTLLAIRRVPEVTGVVRGLDRLLF